MLTIKQAYLKDPTRCPYCQSRNIVSSDNFTGEGDFGDQSVIYVYMWCESCGRTWTDKFKLIGMEEVGNL